MAEKNIDQQVAEKEAEIVKLKAEQAELKRKAEHQEYPKWIADPSDESGAAGRTVASADEEKAVLDSYADAYAANKKRRDIEKKIADLRAEADKADIDARDEAKHKAAAPKEKVK